MVISFLSSHLAVVLFLILAFGLALGNIKVYGFSLGSSAVLFVAIIFGYFNLKVPDEIGNLGVILFVYALGLQVGPRFFRTIARNGFKYIVIAFLALLSAACTIWFLSKLFHISPALGMGIFAGALTSTPALAAALNVLQDPSISVGYVIAYPFGVIGVVLFVQILAGLKRTRQEIKDEKTGVKTSDSKVLVKEYEVTNPNCTGKPLIEIDLHSMTEANITRVMRGDRVFMSHDNTVLQLNDAVRAIGTVRELKKLEHLIGKETKVDMDFSKDIAVRDVFVSSPQVAGKSLAELEIKELFGVVLTRLWRDEVEIVPIGSTMLEIGDLIRVAGDNEDCEQFVRIVGQQERRIHETNLLAFSTGIVLGALLGFYPINLPGGITFNLGLAGGPLLVAVLVGHFGRIGRISTRVPYAAKYLLREIGLMFFLACAGSKAGGSFVTVLQQTGLTLILFGGLTTVIAMCVSYLTSYYIFRLGILPSLGTVCGAMTSTPALGVVTGSVDTDTPIIAYASIYPLALVFITVMSQILALIL